VAIPTIVFGVLLVALGLGSYVVTAMESWTALIPAGFGLVLALLGGLALKESLRKHAMHAAAAVGLIGLIGGLAMAVPHLGELISTGHATRADPAHPDATGAVVCQLLLAALCGVFVGLCVKSFIDARRRRKAAEAAAAK
jgi:DMSO reductase anchor subunit